MSLFAPRVGPVSLRLPIALLGSVSWTGFQKMVVAWVPHHEPLVRTQRGLGHCLYSGRVRTIAESKIESLLPANPPAAVIAPELVTEPKARVEHRASS